MAFFPASPTDGQQANVGNITYQWSAAIGAWNRVGSTVNSFLVDGATVAISGNIFCSGSGTSQFAADLDVGGNITAGANVNSATINTGNILASNISTTSVTAAGALSAGSITTTGTIIATGQISTSSILSSSQQVTAPAVITSGNITAGTNIIGGGNVTVPGTVSAQDVSATGNVTALTNISSSGTVTASGNITGGNVISLGAVSATGNVSGNYILGNGSLLTGVVTGGGGAGNRANVTINTGSIANAATFTGNINMAKGYAVYKITTTDAAWVRLYSNATTQSADSSRDQDTDPQPGSGVMVEAITNGANIVLISPAALGWNDDNPPSNAIPISVTNLSGGSADIGVTFTYLGVEL